MPETEVPDTAPPGSTIPSSVGPVAVNGNPTKEEVAAIVAAIETVWPKPASAAVARRERSTAWRYSGRWWQQGRLPNRWS